MFRLISLCGKTPIDREKISLLNLSSEAAAIRLKKTCFVIVDPLVRGDRYAYSRGSSNVQPTERFPQGRALARIHKNMNAALV